MPIKKFYIKGNGKVIDVGLRPSLVTLGLAYDLKVATRNLFEENEVEVIVSGAEESIKRFWERIKKEDVRPIKEEKSYALTECEPYEGVEPDWAYHVSASLMEQIYKGISRIEGIEKGLEALGGIQETLKGIDNKFGEMVNRFGVFSEYAKAIGQRLDALPEQIAKAVSKKE
jgi:acylphosphatase